MYLIYFKQKNKLNIGIAVSGGPDSMSLCWLINKYYKNKLNIHCFTVNHGIREGIIKIINIQKVIMKH